MNKIVLTHFLVRNYEKWQNCSASVFMLEANSVTLFQCCGLPDRTRVALRAERTLRDLWTGAKGPTA